MTRCDRARGINATTLLVAGTVALGEKTLLGWIRLRFPNGQTGWVRKEEVIALWQ